MAQTAQRLRAVAAVPFNTDPAMKAPIRRITWKPDEQAKVIARAGELMAETPNLPAHVAAKRAQEEVLPSERWRKIRQQRDTALLFGERESDRAVTPSAALEPPTRKFPAAILPALPLPADDPPPLAAAPPSPALPEAPQPVTAPTPATAVDPATVRALVEQMGPMLATTIDRCMRTVFEAIAEAVRAAAPHDSHPSSGVAPATVVKPPPRNRLPRITVVGLIHQQETDVAAAFAGVVEFVFVKSQKQGGGGHGGAGMLTKSASSDLVIAMTDFIGHDVEASAKHLHVPFERCKGSVSALKRWITDWLATGRTE